MNNNSLDKVQKQLFPNINLTEVHGTRESVFRAKIAYMPHEVFLPHPSNPRFEHCNIIGVDFLRLNEAHLNLRFPGPMSLTIPPLGSITSNENSDGGRVVT